MSTTTGIVGCWARAARGHAAADPAIPARKSRRRIASLRRGQRQNWLSTQTIRTGNGEQRNTFAPQKCSAAHVCIGSKAAVALMSALSPLLPEADIEREPW